MVIVSIMDVESLQQIAGDYRTYRTIEEIDALIADIAQKLSVAVPRNTSALPGLSVPPFNIASGVNQNDAMALAQILSCDLANAGKYAVLPRTDSIDKVMEEQRRQRDGTTDQERIKRLGVGRNAKYVLSGSIQRLGNLNKFGVDILDILDGSFIDGYEESYNAIGDGVTLMASLSGKLTGTASAVTIQTTVTSIPSTPPAANTNSIISPNAGWQTNVDSSSTASMNMGREYIDGRERDVLTLETNLARGDEKWVGIFTTGNDIAQKLRTASGVRFKVLGDGKTWSLAIPMTETKTDGNTHQINITTRNGRVVEIDIPFSRLKQPTWGKRVTFNKNSITGMSIERNNSHGAGASIIKIFDFEVY